ncbi:MAG: nucleotidyltransferase family protein [Clostridiales bacterium]|jgi:CTP:molybdopterin cytidylyltransferase MocA|nr:nucleotidyltransferase family protein [Clostridiales bacterium]
MKTYGVVAAAGLSSRMGAFKPLMTIGGEAVLTRTVKSMINGGASRVVVVLGHRAEEARAVLRSPFPAGVQYVLNPDFGTTDMLASVKLGLAQLPPIEADRVSPAPSVFFLPGDMPFVAPDTFRILKEQAELTRALVVFPLLDGRRGHPPLISCRCLPRILDFSGPGGLRGALGMFADKTIEVEVNDKGCRIDLDTMEDYEEALEMFMK